MSGPRGAENDRRGGYVDHRGPSSGPQGGRGSGGMTLLPGATRVRRKKKNNDERLWFFLLVFGCAALLGATARAEWIGTRPIVSVCRSPCSWPDLQQARASVCCRRGRRVQGFDWRKKLRPSGPWFASLRRAAAAAAAHAPRTDDHSPPFASSFTKKTEAQERRGRQALGSKARQPAVHQKGACLNQAMIPSTIPPCIATMTARQHHSHTHRHHTSKQPKPDAGTRRP